MVQITKMYRVFSYNTRIIALTRALIEGRPLIEEIRYSAGFTLNTYTPRIKTSSLDKNPQIITSDYKGYIASLNQNLCSV